MVYGYFIQFLQIASIILGLYLVFALLLTIFCRDSTIHFNGIDPEKDVNIFYAYFIRLYYTTITLSSTGYGDITPKSILAKFLTIIIIIFVVANILYYLRRIL